MDPMVPPGWDAIPAGYLAFRDTYAAGRAAAQARGWPVRTMAGAHLHMLCDPAGVVAQIVDLAQTTVPLGPPG